MEIFILIPYSEAYIKKYKWKVDCVEFQVNVPEVYEGKRKGGINTKEKFFSPYFAPSENNWIIFQSSFGEYIDLNSHLCKRLEIISSWLFWGSHLFNMKLK